MEIIKNILIAGSRERPIAIDSFFRNDGKPKPVLIFSHGFKGFKDWGHFNLMGERFASEGFVFVKFNFSHNGTTPENPLATEDLEAFGTNNYVIELDDLGLVIDWVYTAFHAPAEIDREKICLLGHSRGGGISILKAGEDKRVKKLITWASVADFLHRNSKETIDRWKKEGVTYTTNMRTGQKLPLYYQFHETMLANKDRVDVMAVARKLKIPFLIIHGTGDDAVPAEEAQALHKACPHSKILILRGAGHTFGIKHPFEKDLTADAKKVLEETIAFLRN